MPIPASATLRLYWWAGTGGRVLSIHSLRSYVFMCLASSVVKLLLTLLLLLLLLNTESSSLIELDMEPVLFCFSVGYIPPSILPGYYCACKPLLSSSLSESECLGG